MEKGESILKKFLDEAKGKNATIVLPESEDLRILEAANRLVKDNICNIILIGSKDKILEKLNQNGMGFENSIKVIDPEKYEKLESVINDFYNLRKHKGITIDDAKNIIKNPVYFATMLVYQNIADGMVAGASFSSADTLRPALQIIKQKDDVDIVSSFFIMETKDRKLGEDGVFIFSDCGLVKDPNAKQLCNIAISSAESFKSLVKKEPKVAFLSFSTKGSAKCESADKINEAMNILNSKNVWFDYDGELQLDAAIIKEVASLKARKSSVAGSANVLIFPNLDAGNIGYKIAQRFGKMLAIGPITQGLRAPINDLSRGCDVDDIMGAVAITILQSKYK